jgi:hypothetical protein
MGASASNNSWEDAMRALPIAVLALVLSGVGIAAFAANSPNDLNADLTGYQEVPTLSSSGTATLQARISNDESSVDWVLSYDALEAPVTQSHIHLAAPAINGPIVVFFCTNLGNGPAGTQACPPPPATISGTFTSADVLAAGTIGLEAGNLAELIRAIRAGATYANVHSTLRPGGEVRGLIRVQEPQPGPTGAPPK